MKLLHTSDWHVGRSLHGVDLSEDHRYFFRELIDLVRREQIDAVLVAGDVYDRAVPNIESITILEDALAELCAITKVILTPGNHDSAVRLGQNERFLTDRLVIRSKLEDIGKPVIVDNGSERVAVYPLPYIRVDEGRRFFAENPKDEETWLERSHEAVIGAALGQVHQNLQELRGEDKNLPAVVMAHLFAVGGEGSESERDISVGGVDSVASEVFSTLGGSDPNQECPVNYFALGHLHGPQEIPGSDKTILRYSGSPIAFSFSEADHEKSVTILDFEAGKLSLRTVPTPVRRRLVTITDSIEAIESGQYDQFKDYYASVSVTGDKHPTDMKQRVLKVLPYAITCVFVPNARPDLVEIAPLVAKTSDPQEVCEEFFVAASGGELSDSVKELIQNAVETVRERSQR